MDKSNKSETAFLISVFVIATCGLIYELIAGTLASYLLGDSVLQFSTIIGCYLFSMGIGSYLSRFIEKDLIANFIRIEILVGVLGGFSAGLLFFIFDYVSSFQVVLYLIVSLIGILVGIEIPLLLRILKDKFEFKDLVSKVFTFDYAGALFASILFPLVLVPQLGLVRSSLMFGMFNVAVAIWMIKIVDDQKLKRHNFAAFTSLIFLVIAFAYSEQLVSTAEASNYSGSIIFSKNTKYQKISLVRQDRELRLFLNGNLQFSSLDEYRYHEALVQPAYHAAKSKKNVLILGGGDGLAARELLKHPEIEKITLVDLDPGMTDLFRNSEILKNLNQNSLNSNLVNIINADAYQWVKNYSGKSFDIVIIDFPDPSNYSLGKLYSLSFYNKLNKIIHSDSVIAVQSTSPFFARLSFWCINNTIAAAGFKTVPYHFYIPSFGEWGYVLASRNPVSININKKYKFIDQLQFDAAKLFPADMEYLKTSINRLDDQVLVRYFTEDWSQYSH